MGNDQIERKEEGTDGCQTAREEVVQALNDDDNCGMTNMEKYIEELRAEGAAR